MDCDMTKYFLVFYRLPKHGIWIVNKALEMSWVRAAA